jgi:hypothetical protein
MHGLATTSRKKKSIAAFKFSVREEAREYEKEFPDQLYEEWYRLYELPTGTQQAMEIHAPHRWADLQTAG